MSEDCCGNCRFGRIKKENVREVDCFRYPSQVSVVLVGTPTGQPAPLYLNATPVMESADWCGEYQPKKPILSREIYVQEKG